MPAFKPISKKFSFPEEELKVLEFWKEISAFEQSLENRKSKDGSNTYTFYDGPPFATGLPHYGHFVASTLKDVVPRYWTMRGKYVERRFGWDTHGLPIEMETEKVLGLSGPTEIKKHGVAEFNEACRSGALKHVADWEKIITRLGRWVDFKKDYKTMDASFMESVWWAFSELWKKELVYEDFRVMPFSWRLSTPLSNFEANLDYRSIQDPAITIRLKLMDDSRHPGPRAGIQQNDWTPDQVRGDKSGCTYLLVWTTTPWTLPSNLAVAVGRDIDYVRAKIEGDDRVYIVAKERLESVLGKDAEVLEAFKGEALLGKHYAPLFEHYVGQSPKLFQVLDGHHVTTESGTGLVHMAPAFGQEDFDICREAKIPFMGNERVDDEGRLVDLGVNIKEADPILIKQIKEKDLLFKHETCQHSYPFCWRSGTPLIYRAIPSWFVRVTEIKDRLVENNKLIHWVPEAVGDKRFGNWLKDAQDWCISRNRFWGTPIPLWQCESCKEHVCLSSIAELEEKTGKKIDDIHPHKIDHLSFKCTKCTGVMKRIPEVFDCWFESGSMPYAQNHYPFENEDSFDAKFPADFIAEGLDQTRAWFYTLLVLSTALFDKNPFKNVVVNGMVLASDGSKMSKSKKNYPDPSLVMNEYGADALRAYLINSPVVRAEPLQFQEKGVREIVRTVMLPLYHAWSFLIQYANIDGWQPPKSPPLKKRGQGGFEIDRWILSKLQSLISEINTQMEGYYLYRVIPPMLGFIDDLTNWYIRRSRRRFWKNATDEASKADKEAAYQTLYEVLLTFSKVIAPVLPFISETIYQNLNPDTGKSVHTCDYPQADASKIDKKLEQEVEITRQVISLGRALREKHKLKTRQPLQEVIIVTHVASAREAVLNHAELVQQELNVKKVVALEDDHTLCDISLKPNFKTLGRRLGARMKEGSQAISKFSRPELSKLQAGESLSVAGVDVILEDVTVTRTARADIVLETEGALTVALETDLTPELVEEGLMRETLSQLQKLRKDIGLEVTDRIELKFQTNSKELEKVLRAAEGYLKEELLAQAISWESSHSSASQSLDIDGYELQVLVIRCTQ
ncbi:MAG: isoleucine--tRNA ligase [Deltaproteobacteria bacterium]|nr:isoleucine--tRNA ligase [Deltaproteobacteria bacterium]